MDPSQTDPGSGTLVGALIVLILAIAAVVRAYPSLVERRGKRADTQTKTLEDIVDRRTGDLIERQVSEIQGLRSEVDAMRGEIKLMRDEAVARDQEKNLIEMERDRLRDENARCEQRHRDDQRDIASMEAVLQAAHEELRQQRQNATDAQRTLHAELADLRRQIGEK